MHIISQSEVICEPSQPHTKKETNVIWNDNYGFYFTLQLTIPNGYERTITVPWIGAPYLILYKKVHDSPNQIVKKYSVKQRYPCVPTKNQITLCSKRQFQSYNFWLIGPNANLGTLAISTFSSSKKWVEFFPTREKLDFIRVSHTVAFPLTRS